MNGLDRFLAGLLFVLGILCVAGIVHIVAIFALPRLASPDAFAQLSMVARPAHMTLLPRPAPDTKLIPFADPAVARGICLFDLSRAALRLRGAVETDRLVTFSFRTRAGHVFYSMTDRAAQRGKIDVLVLSPAQLETIEAEASDDDEPSQELRLVAPSIQGMVFVDALAEFPGEWPQAEQRVEQMICEVEPVAEE